MAQRAAKITVAALLKREGIDPFLEMAHLAQADDTPPAVKAQLWSQLGRYCAPQLRAIEITEPGKPPSGDVVKRAQQELFGLSPDE